MSEPSTSPEGHLRLAPQFQIPQFGILRSSDIHEASREDAQRVQKNLRGLRDHYLEYVGALALRELANKQMEVEHAEWDRRRSAGEFSMPPAMDSLWQQWSRSALGLACMAIRNYVFALEPIQRLHGKVPEWRGVVDSAAIKAARISFDARFPNIERARHAVAHPEGFNAPNTRNVVTGEVRLGDDSILAENAGTVSMTNCHINGRLVTTFEGQLIEVEVNGEAALFLKENAMSVAKAFQAIAL